LINVYKHNSMFFKDAIYIRQIIVNITYEDSLFAKVIIVS
jgi:hypothetical protein